MSTHTRIVAEMACSHEGDERLARVIIDAAGQARADAVQFQMWALAEMVVPHHPDYCKLQSLELAPDAWRGLAAYTRERHPELQIVACVYERSSVDFAESIGVDGYKIHSGDLSNPSLLQHVGATSKPIHLSIGSSTVDEIAEALGPALAGGSPVVLMYGFQSFPTPLEDVNLSYLPKLHALFGLPVGYQDHCDADSPEALWIPAAAAGMGVAVLEKHLTHDRRLEGIDHESALNPDEFATFVRMVHAVDTARGSDVPRPFTEAEVRYRKYAKKSLVAARPLDAGHVVVAADLRPMRADLLGLPPTAAGTLIGRRLKRPVDAYRVVTEADIE